MKFNYSKVFGQLVKTGSALEALKKISGSGPEEYFQANTACLFGILTASSFEKAGQVHSFI